ncbi:MULTISPECIES: protocatechuate 3,4-dioxygenase subunit alpha [unclassified Caballeronia]|uniref:protocatechuate 3,4-dioxygenase subunit alpha n=1 Tax=unclassified Caballeronia TaxID=2646786 RepID=UPI002864C32D|nr:MULTISPECIES: protocatechuate 3,4-dioxygenase subunit alpha [unclassified Caballeronia]MDR5753619.1 protocatechuate 3,4-dioxygenase subunit alpha [Caballeronia sp. LZ024]MDR5839998.1 protocatechuate 3,4-dioxygenase subunit alpha [Caballeronia sp. LZ031]
MTALKQTPSQTVGPYFAYGLCPEQYNFDLKSLFTPSIADREAKGEHISVVGNVYDGEGKVVGDAVIEMAQADSTGHYVQTVEEARESGFRGFARVGTGTDPKLRFVVDTVKPGKTGDDAAPHIDVIVLMRGMLLHAYTRIYFDDESEANAKDTVLASVPEERRATLIAKREPGTSSTIYRFDIYLQGPQETVFFDL